MQINNIAINTQKCKKPCISNNFKGSGSFSSGKKVRYKHYEQMSDDVLHARSIIKAHRDAQKSAKMRLYKAIPSIATGIIATSLAIAQPGKLSAKAAAGLGFLAAGETIGAIDEIASKDSEKRKNGFKKLGAVAALGAGYLASKGKFKSDKLSSISEFAKKEVTQLASEINSTKLANFSEKHIEPFMKKHPKLTFLTPIATVCSTFVLGKLASVGLIKGISKDIKQNAAKNYEHGKMIQQIARNHFDSVDAVEV